MNTIEKGAIAEQKVILRAIEKGIVVSRPITPTRYDLLFDDGKDIKRVQVKYGDGGGNSENAVSVQLRSWSNGSYKVYTEDEVDIILAYIPKIDKIVQLPSTAFGKRTLSIRLAEAKNGHHAKCNFADDLVW